VSAFTDPSRGTPNLPPASPAPTPDAIALALRDPDLMEAAKVPYLPAPTPPKPSVAAPPVFDAKAMVAATKRKVENPLYGHIPAPSAENKAAMEVGRAEMRRKRRRDKLVGRVMAVIFLAVAAGAGYALFRLYQHDQSDRSTKGASVADDANSSDPANMGPLGEQVDVIDAQDAMDSAATASAGGLVGAIDAAEQAADQTNSNAGLGNTFPLDEVLPDEIIELASELEAVDGLSRYVVDIDHVSLREPITTPGWILHLQQLPQAPELSPSLALLPSVNPGELAIAVQVSGDQVTRLIAYAPSDNIRIDL
jgi:hypothetical protein